MVREHVGLASLKQDIPYRTLGRTGVEVSVIGLGGYHIGIPNLSEEESIRIIRTAIDNGINFMDNCWDYNDGLSEIRMGKALQGGYRDKVFLMTKIDGQYRKIAEQQIQESLRRLQTDRIDLLQFHEVIRIDDCYRIFGEGGAIEAALEARDAGKISYIGFTGHKSPNIHLKMLEVASKHNFTFDAVMMPLNVMDAHFESFEKKVLPVLNEQNIGVIGMKPFGFGQILKSKLVDPIECLHYVMSLPIDVVVTGCESLPILEQALKAARTFKPMTENMRISLLERTAKAAETGRFEPYKTTKNFDMTDFNPHWAGFRSVTFPR
ncbi:MAG: aldo/keto reductase [Candidatus Bathyarchaeia archaeon]